MVRANLTRNFRVCQPAPFNCTQRHKDLHLQTRISTNVVGSCDRDRRCSFASVVYERATEPLRGLLPSSTAPDRVNVNIDVTKYIYVLFFHLFDTRNNHRMCVKRIILNLRCREMANKLFIIFSKCNYLQNRVKRQHFFLHRKIFPL